MQFLDQLNNLLKQIIQRFDLPENSLHLYTNISPKTKSDVSKSICIYEQDYPPTKQVDIDNLGKNYVVMNIQDANEYVELLIRNLQFETIPLPNTATYQTLPSDKAFVHVMFSKGDTNIYSYIEENIVHCLANYRSKAKSFGCCSRFNKCSDAKHCVHVNKLYATACQYRRSLDSGKIFYGKNRNI